MASLTDTWIPYGVTIWLGADASVKRTGKTTFEVNVNYAYKTNGTNYYLKIATGKGSKMLNNQDNVISAGVTYEGSFSGGHNIGMTESGNREVSIIWTNGSSYANPPSKTYTMKKTVNVPAWTSYTISYNANGGSGAPSNQKKWKDEALTLSNTKPTRTGYTFLGWSTNKSASSATYNVGARFTSNANTTLYAVWSENYITVNYYSNHATSASGNLITNTNVSANTNVLVSTQKYYYNNAYNNGLLNFSNSSGGAYMTRTGYNPTGNWGTSVNGDTLVGEDDTSLNTGQNIAQKFGKSLATGNQLVNVYAQWKVKTYTVLYNKNTNDEVILMPSNQTKTHFQNLTLSNNIPKRSQYSFLGWATSTDGGIVYSPGSTYKLESDMTLYAVWRVAGLVYIDNGTKLEGHFVCIDNGSSWDVYVPYIDNGTDWGAIS